MPILATLVVSFPCHSQQFLAEGRLVYALVRPGISEKTWRFVIRKDGEKWKIRTFKENVKENAYQSIDLFWEAGFDGTNMFSLDQQDVKTLRNIADPTLPKAENAVSAQGRVEPRQNPRMEISLINPIWHAYASKSYYSKLMTNKVVQPFFSVEDYSPVLQDRVEWTNGGNRHFVSEVIWYSDGTYPVVTPDHKLEVKRFKSPYSEEFVEARFQVLTWTNFDNISVPGSFSFAKYVPAENSESVATFKVDWRISGFLEKIQKVDSFSARPQLSSKTLVRDFRYMRGGEPTSYTTNSHW